MALKVNLTFTLDGNDEGKIYASDIYAVFCSDQVKQLARQIVVGERLALYEVRRDEDSNEVAGRSIIGYMSLEEITQA